MQLYAAACVSRLNLKGLHMAPVVFEVYMVAPCGSMQLHAAPSWYLQVPESCTSKKVFFVFIIFIELYK